MNAALKIINLAVALCLLVACATPQPVLRAELPVVDWQTHLIQQQALSEWQAQMVIYGQDRDQKFKLRLLWKQQGERYQIKIKDFIGRTVAVLEGVPGEVSLKTSKGQHFQGEDADQLIYELLNLPIHISGMRYLLLGVPEPASPHRLLQVSADGLAAEIQQQGWQLKYLSYSQQSGRRLPSQAAFSIDQVHLRAQIKQWQIP